MKTERVDLAKMLKADSSGAELRRMQRELRSSRDSLIGQSKVVNLDAAAKAYEAGIALLPELWRLEQRK